MKRLSHDDAMTYINSQKPKFLKSTSDGSGYVCPSCSTGSQVGEPGISFNPQTGMYLCPNCNRTSDIIQLMAEKMQINPFASPDSLSKVYAQLSQEYDIEITDESIDVLLKERNRYDQYSNYIRSCHENISMTDYFEQRGIGQNLIDRYFLGYDESFFDGQNYWPAVILPTSQNTYEARNLNCMQNVSDKTKYRKSGKTVIFNADSLNDPDHTPVFVCSGIFDALSIIEVGGKAVAIQSSFSISSITRLIEEHIPTSPLILVLSSSKMNDELAVFCKDKFIPCLIFSEIVEGEYSDINERLLTDKNGLKMAVNKAVHIASSLPDPIATAREEYMSSSAARYIPTLISQIQKDANRPRLTLGFPDIDKALAGGLYPGLYTLGAISSLGKTTFLLQVADNLARQGQDVLFFSLEQSKRELICKSVSRLTYEYCLDKNCATSNAKTALGISDGLRWKDYQPSEIDIMQKCFEQYSSFADHLFIYEGVGNISVKDIRDKVSQHIAFTRNPKPIVMIDYLQVLSVPENERRSTDKQFVDYNITALRQLARDFEISVFCISALNRQSYSDKITMSAFKESGNIEYGSDVLLGLQFHGVEEKDFSVEDAKEKMPRDVEMLILKNRSAAPCSKGIRLMYDPRFNHFVGYDDMMKSIEQFKSGRRYLIDKQN